MTNPTGIEWLDPIIALSLVFLPVVVYLTITTLRKDSNNDR